MRMSDWSSDVCSSELPFDKLRSNGNCGNALSPPHPKQLILDRLKPREIRGLHRAAFERGDLVEFVHQVAVLDVGDQALDKGDRDEPLAARHRRSEEHTSELQSLMRISYAVFCLKKKNTTNKISTKQQ